MKLSIRAKILTGFTLVLVLSTLIVSFLFTIISSYIQSQVTTIQSVEASVGASDIVGFFNLLNNHSASIASVYVNHPLNLTIDAHFMMQNNPYIEQVTILTPLGHELEKLMPRTVVSEEKLSYEVYSDSFKSAVT